MLLLVLLQALQLVHLLEATIISVMPSVVQPQVLSST
jgi:hypothetical protein